MNRYPVRVRARLDAPGRWLWLVKWLLLIPHFVVLIFLGLAFFVMTLVAYVAVLFTGRYPRGIFDFKAGGLRWEWPGGVSLGGGPGGPPGPPPPPSPGRGAHPPAGAPRPPPPPPPGPPRWPAP